MDNLKNLADELSQLDDKLVKCMRCGTCQSVCPVFAETKKESDVTRGKLALLSNLAQGLIDDPKSVRERLDRCLLCGSCQSACPSGVSILDIFMRAREISAQYMGLNPIKKMAFRVMLCNPKLFAFLVKIGRPFHPLFMRDQKNAPHTAKAPLMKLAIGDRCLPVMPKFSIGEKYGDLDIPAGKSGIKVLFFTGCVGDKVYTNVTEACLKIFKHFGVGVRIPKNLACCGIPALASGDVPSFQKMLVHDIDIIAKSDFDYIVTACASCTETIGELWAKYAPPQYADKAEKIGAKAIDINADSVEVRSIDIQGIGGREKAILMKKIDIMPGDKVCRKDIENIVADIFGTQAYDYVTYEMRGKESPFDLVIICRPGPVHQFGFGVRLDTEEIVSVLLNVGLNAHRLQGSRFDFTGKISANPYFRFHYSYDAPKSPTLNASASVKWTDMNFLNLNSGRFNMSYLNVSQEFYLSNLKWTLFDIRAGIRNEYFNVRSLLSSEPIPGDYDLRMLGNDYVSLFLDGRADTFDDGYFPKRGFTAGVQYSWIFAGFPNRTHNFHAVSADAKIVVPGGDIFAFIPSFSARFLFGPDIPVAYMNLMGGSMAGRYMDQQIPFIGISNVSGMRNILTVFRTDFRFNVAKNHYVTGIMNYARDCDTFSTYGSGLGAFGAGVEYSYDSIFGPMTANIHWSSLTKRIGFYIGLGYNF